MSPQKNCLIIHLAQSHFSLLRYGPVEIPQLADNAWSPCSLSTDSTSAPKGESSPSAALPPLIHHSLRLAALVVFNPYGDVLLKAKNNKA